MKFGTIPLGYFVVASSASIFFIVHVEASSQRNNGITPDSQRIPASTSINGDANDRSSEDCKEASKCLMPAGL